MKYLLLIHGSGGGAVQDWLDYAAAVREAGILVAGEAPADPSLATSVTVGAGGERVVTDGPEDREALSGFYVIDVPDLDAATDWAARCPGARGGTVVVRPVAEYA